LNNNKNGFLCLGIDGEPGLNGTKGLKGEWGLVGK